MNNVSVSIQAAIVVRLRNIFSCHIVCFKFLDKESSVMVAPFLVDKYNVKNKKYVNISKSK